MTDLGSEQSAESELMSDPSSCDELWLLPQQVLAMDVDLLQVRQTTNMSHTFASLDIQSHVLVHLFKSLRADIVKSSSTLFSKNIQ